MLFEHSSVMYFINTFRCYPARLRPELAIRQYAEGPWRIDVVRGYYHHDHQLRPKTCWITAKCIDKIHDRTMLEEYGNYGPRAEYFCFMLYRHSARYGEGDEDGSDKILQRMWTNGVGYVGRVVGFRHVFVLFSRFW